MKQTASFLNETDHYTELPAGFNPNTQTLPKRLLEWPAQSGAAKLPALPIKPAKSIQDLKKVVLNLSF